MRINEMSLIEIIFFTPAAWLLFVVWQELRMPLHATIKTWPSKRLIISLVIFVITVFSIMIYEKTY
jgi:hypothetical protein